MEEKIVIDLQGMGLSNEELIELQKNLLAEVITYFQDRGSPHAEKVAALGPGWVGMQVV